MQVRYRFTFGLLFFTLFGLAQISSIEGYVIGSNGRDTLAGAAVALASGSSTLSAANGWYSLEASEGTYLLECRLVGYAPFKKTIKLSPGKVLRFDVKLEVNTNPLDEIVISAGRYEQKLGETTVSADILRPALIQNKNVTSLEQALVQIPGFVVADGQASIRGGSGFSYGAGSRVLMLVDEIPMISADAGDIKWNYLPLENLEQVEIVKGASSVLYGSGALNGVINLRTAFARNEPRTQATMFYGVYDAPRHTFKWWKGSSQSQKGVNFSHSQRAGNLDIVIGAHKFADDGFRMLETESRDRFNTNLRYHFKKFPRLSAGVNVNMMNTSGGLFFLWHNYDSAYIPQGFKIQRYNNSRINADPWVTWTVVKDSVNNYKASFRNRYFKTQNTNDKGQGSYAELYYSELQLVRNFRNLNLTGGLVRMQQVILGDSLYGTHHGTNLAAYVQAGRKFFEKLNVTAGLRCEYFKLDSAKTTGFLFNTNSGPALPFQPVFRIGMNYQAARNTYIRASFGQGYRFPSAAEKFVSTSVNILQVFPNPSLQPERAFSCELSARQGFRIGNFQGYGDLAFFYTRYSNMIEFVFDIYRPGGSSGNFFSDLPWAGFKSQNVGEAEISGTELSITGTGKIGPVKTTLLTGYTYINPIMPGYDASRDTLGLPGVKTLKYRSRHLFKADIQFEFGKFAMGYSARYQSRIENIDRKFVQSVFEEYSGPSGINFSAIPSTYILPGMNENYKAFSKSFVVQDLRMSVQANDLLRFSFIINNVANIEYQNRPGDVRAPRMFIAQVMVKI